MSNHIIRNTIEGKDGIVTLAHLQSPKVVSLGVTDIGEDFIVITLDRKEAIQLRKLLDNYISRAALTELGRNSYHPEVTDSGRQG